MQFIQNPFSKSCSHTYKKPEKLNSILGINIKKYVKESRR